MKDIKQGIFDSMDYEKFPEYKKCLECIHYSETERYNCNTFCIEGKSFSKKKRE